MKPAPGVLAVNNDLPIKTDAPIHSGKVRSVYWLSPADSARLIEARGYNTLPDAPLAIMVISDRISAFDCIWRGENGLEGVPGKGAALNAISNHWFAQFKAHGLADSHILEVPHPLVWIVQKAKPVYIEAIARQYITGSMWRAYDKGEREFCGIRLPEGLSQHQKLNDILVTPSTKGILEGIPGVPPYDDANIAQQTIREQFQAFGFNSADDAEHYQSLLKQGFSLISQELEKIGQTFVDTKFEFGYVQDQQGNDKLIYMDEVGTPDSSRIWDSARFERGEVVEQSKEAFRQHLLNHFPDPDILLNKHRMGERSALAKNNLLPEDILMATSTTYTSIAEKITGKALLLSEDPKAEIIETLHEEFKLIR